MIELAQPWLLLLWPLPVLSWWLLPPHRQRVNALRVPFFQELAHAAGVEAHAGAVILRRGVLQMVLASVAWSMLVVGLAKPEWVGEPIVRVESARDVMLAIDLSGSMDFRDFPDQQGEPVRRMDAVQRVVDRFVSERKDDRIGLIVFGNRPYVQLPFSRDLETARALVALMEVGMAGPQTALGDAIGLAIRSFESSQVDQRLLILLTDGSDTASTMTPVNAAGIAALAGVEIHTIGIGDSEAVGEDRVDFEVLRSVAQRTGGRFFDAQDENALAEVYRRIDQMSPADVRTESWRPRVSLVHWPAGAIVVLAVCAYGALLLGARSREAEVG
ncbi:MAG TPA: VWA domain-containing protein [Myxococcales bacterium]|nr:VWA domain-containing protein [Myxococcales bacterium]HIL80010.1 VWA domain-containing protein [Myxococcales bacterium]